MVQWFNHFITLLCTEKNALYYIAETRVVKKDTVICIINAILYHVGEKSIFPLRSGQNSEKLDIFK